MTSRHYSAKSTSGADQKYGGRLLQQYDSGFGEVFSSMPTTSASAASGTFGVGVPPIPPTLMVDVENSDFGITVDDTVEKDCAATFLQRKPTTSQAVPAPMEVCGKPTFRGLIARGAESRSPVATSRAKRPRVPKKMTYSGPSSSSSSSDDGTMSALLMPRSASPSSSSSISTDAYSTSSYIPSMNPPRFLINKENRGPATMPPVRSGSPLTCNNFQRPSVARVPPMDHHGSGVFLDIYQLREYMAFFLPDTKEGDTGFHLAVIHNQVDLLDKLLFIMSKDRNLRPVIDEQNALFQTALHLATHLQQLEMMRKLLIAGASINITDHKGNTPLHIAARFSSTRPLEEITKYISAQAVLEVAQIRNNEGLSCVHVAAKHGNMEILRKLQHIGVDMNIQDFNSGKTALHVATESNSLANVQFLLETCEAEVNSVTYSGCSPLHMASGRGDISVVAYLISMGADPELCTDEGDIALDLAGSNEVNSFLTRVASLF